MFKRIVSLGLTALLAVPALAQDFMYPHAGRRPATHLKFQGVCINSQILEERNTEAVFRQMMEFKAKTSPPPKTRGSLSACLTKIDEDIGDILKLENGAIVEITQGYLGYVGYRKNALLFKKNSRWEIWIEGKKVFPVDLHRKPQRCSTPSAYPIEAVANDEIFVINGEKFEAQTYCLGWTENESVIFLDGSEYGACASASIFNISRAESCDVWCD